MPKKAIVFYKNTSNIGDDVQSIAALNLLKNPNVLMLDRENLDKVREVDIKLLCNGWFMFNGENWPPAKGIDPYFISFHIAKYPEVRRQMLSKSLVEYYKKYEPIGCRDFVTKDLFKQIGIQAYYSGCVTLTLDEFKGKRSNDIIITDLFINNILSEEYAGIVSYKLVPEEFHKDVKLRTHIRKNTDISEQDQLKEGRELLAEYAQAKLVITSRIHCALPCLAMGTPVVFFDFGYVRKTNRDRFGGILDLMNTIRPKLPFHENRRIDKIVKLFGLHKLFYPFIKPLDIDWSNPKPNPTKHLAIADDIRKRVQEQFNF